MEKKDALLVLVDNSILLSQQEKELIRRNIVTFTEEQIDNLGSFLALEQKTIHEKKEAIGTILGEIEDGVTRSE